MTTSSGTRHTTFTALLLGLRSLSRYPGLAVAFLLATLAQGTLQGGMVWALRQVLITLTRPGGVNHRVLLVGALAVCAVWLVRSAGVYAAQVFAGRLASRVELQWMRWVLEKLLTLSVGFFVQELLAPLPVVLDTAWGLDHGTWSVLKHAYPAADVPVVQLSIDETRPPAFHYDIGRRLAPLRAEGVLIVGSGNLVHNLHAYAWGQHMPEPYEWAVRFETEARGLLLTADHGPLVDYESLGREALLSIPTPDHYLPLLYVIGARQQRDAITFPVEGVDGGSISMLAVRLGGA